MRLFWLYLLIFLLLFSFIFYFLFIWFINFELLRNVLRQYFLINFLGIRCFLLSWEKTQTLIAWLLVLFPHQMMKRIPTFVSQDDLEIRTEIWKWLSTCRTVPMNFDLTLKRSNHHFLPEKCQVWVIFGFINWFNVNSNFYCLDRKTRTVWDL